MLENTTEDIADASSSTAPRPVGRNKTGKNQYKDRPLRDDPHVAELLKEYHLKGITDKKQISTLLLDDHAIILSASSISRRKRELGLRSSRLTTLQLSSAAKRQLILDQMAKDPAGKYGPRMVKQKIFEQTGIHLTRDYIRSEMKVLDPVGSSTRGPAHVKAKRRGREEEILSKSPDHFIFDTRMSNIPSVRQPSDEDSDPSSPMAEDPPRSAPSVSTSPPILAIVNTLASTTPLMRSLIRDIESIEGVAPLSTLDCATLMDGLESAALLERALSRLISKSRPFSNGSDQ